MATTVLDPRPGVDLEAYLERIAYGGDVSPSRAVLEALHLAHATHIPFENLDILLGRPVSIELSDIQAKLVRGRRGGYCYEHNVLFAAVLKNLGFAVTALAARVRYRTSQILPRTHMLMLVDLDGAKWVADVGFGAEGLLLPVPFGGGEAARQFAWTYRVMDEGGHFVLQSLRDGSWIDLYAFTLDPQYPIDFQMANHYTSTHPSSRFVQTLVVQKLAPEARTSLRNYELIVDSGSAITCRQVAESDILDTLADTFDLRFPPETRFRFPGGSW